jgi:hypothetical protein
MSTPRDLLRGKVVEIIKLAEHIRTTLEGGLANKEAAALVQTATKQLKEQADSLEGLLNGMRQ